MAEPTSTSIASAATLGAALLASFPGIDAGIVLGAFAGAAVFVLSSKDLHTLKKLAYLALAFFAGVLAAPMFAALLATVLPASVAVPTSVGALLSAALVIKLLLWVIEQASDPLAFVSRLKGGK
ncbi:phage holin family protein [Laribacter hongkongensis]|uniref:putative holin n=1 Tax=Laribacter hongkongensis TaxID=168471 RepID=UPI001EFE0197|nr:putative holin [Laribacter hongkongensis]MCG9124303.1 phage holin family protein [Laribacter hongkongensis]